MQYVILFKIVVTDVKNTRTSFVTKVYEEKDCYITISHNGKIENLLVNVDLLIVQLIYD